MPSNVNKLLVFLAVIALLVFAVPNIRRRWQESGETPRFLHLASNCRVQHRISPHAYRVFDIVPILIFYHVWLPSNGNARVIVEGQLQDLESSGLLHRRFVRLHIAVVSSDEGEMRWFKELPALTKFPSKISVRYSTRNQWEFPGIRWAWESSCDALNMRFETHTPPPLTNETLVLYMHSKGSSHGSGRKIEEMRMTSEFISDWRDIVGIFASMRSVDTLGLGGLGWHWFTFWWARAEYLRTQATKPILTDHRYYYEEWIGYRSATCEGECSQKTGIDKTIDEEPLVLYNSTTFFLSDPLYSTIRCGHAHVEAPTMLLLFNFPEITEEATSRFETEVMPPRRANHRPPPVKC